jgi:AcrR family transcriptional regulator
MRRDQSNSFMPTAASSTKNLAPHQADKVPPQSVHGRRSTKRDPAGTRRRILDAGQSEFAQHGYSGANVGRIAAAARCNIRMIYHYFGSKENLYISVLEGAYDRIRAHERQLNLEAYDPVPGMRRLVQFTFDYLLRNPDLVALIRNENLLGARFLKYSQQVPQSTRPLVQSIGNLLARGRATGAFHGEADAMQLYITLLSLCFIHISNRHTLTVMFQRDLSDRDWLQERRRHVVQVVLAYLTTGAQPHPE